MSRKATCSTRTRIEEEEEDADEREADSAKDKAAEVRPMKTTPNFGRKMGPIAEHSEEGGYSISARTDKTQPNADIVENSATTKKNADRRSVNQLPEAENSRITRRTPTTKTVAECS